MSKNNKWKKYIGVIGILFLFPLAWVLFFAMGSEHHFNTLQYYGPESSEPQAHSDYTLPDFVFENQEGETFSSDSLKGKIWIASFYSMDDPHLPEITERLLNINWRYRDEPDVYIICFSTNPEKDIPALTVPYVNQNTRYNSFPGKWQFLRGDRLAMDSFLRNGFFVEDLKNESIFRLVDDKGHIRALYGNTEFHMKNAAEDIALLKKEIDLSRYKERKKNEKSE
jgi:protein SCO1